LIWIGFCSGELQFAMVWENGNLKVSATDLNLVFCSHGLGEWKPKAMVWENGNLKVSATDLNLVFCSHGLIWIGFCSGELQFAMVWENGNLKVSATVIDLSFRFTEQPLQNYTLFGEN